MVTRDLSYTYEEYTSLNQLSPKIRSLIEQACKYAKMAYAPYSEFRVGAVAELENGLTLSANNQENAAYPSGLCAERGVLFFANANYPEVAVTRLVIVAYDKDGMTRAPVYPCGACRQVMIESQDRFKKPMEVWMVGSESIQKVSSVDPLLPLKFSL